MPDWTNAGVWIDGAAVDIKIVLGQHFGTLVNGSTRSIECTAQHVVRDTKLQAGSRELDGGLKKVVSKEVTSVWHRYSHLLDIDACGALEHLNNSSVA